MAEHIGNYRHGMYGTPTYKSWSEMKHRCGTRWWKNVRYCPEWEKFESFYADMGERPIGTTLDRIDCRGDYCKENCRWADAETQQNNRKNNRKYFIEGEFRTLPQISRLYGISRSALANRIYLKKMSMEEAIADMKGGMTYR